MACFLATPISYVISANTTEAAPPPPPRHRMAPPPPPQDDKVPDWKKHHHLIKTDGSQHLKDKLHHLHRLDMVVIDKEKPLINYLSEVFYIILL